MIVSKIVADKGYTFYLNIIFEKGLCFYTDEL